MLTVGGAGIPARTTASSRNLLSVLLQCRGQELKVSGAKRKANAHSSYYMHTSPYSFYKKISRNSFFILMIFYIFATTLANETE